mgnify:CR=1 FL=1
MGSNSSFSARRTALAMAVALCCAWQSPVFAHGSEAHMVPMDKTLQDFGADVQWDDYAQMFTIAKDGAFVKVKPGAKTAIVNGKTLTLEVPVVMKGNKAFISETFINDVFQSGLDQTEIRNDRGFVRKHLDWRHTDTVCRTTRVDGGREMELGYRVHGCNVRLESCSRHRDQCRGSDAAVQARTWPHGTAR